MVRVTDLNRYDSVPRAVYVVQRRGDRLREHKTRAGRATLGELRKRVIAVLFQSN